MGESFLEREEISPSEYRVCWGGQSDVGGAARAVSMSARYMLL